jgi:hypothetical protein
MVWAVANMIMLLDHTDELDMYNQALFCREQANGLLQLLVICR